MLGQQVPQLRDQVRVLAQGQIQVRPFLDHADPGFGQPVALCIQQRAAQPVADRTAPEPERGVQRRGGLPEVAGRPRGPGPAQLMLEHAEVDRAGRNGQQVPGVGPDQPERRTQAVFPGFPGPEHPAQPRDVPLDQVHRTRGRRVTPDRADQPLPRNRVTGLQEQHGENHPLLYRPEIYLAVAPPGPKRAQNPESWCRLCRFAHAPSRYAEHC